MSASEHIRQHFPSLSPALQTIARYLLEHPNEVVTGSMRSVGTRCGSTPATLVRFAQTLGYRGWPELKNDFSAELGLSSETYVGRVRQLLGRNSDHSLTEEMFEVQRRNLEGTQLRCDAALHRACLLLEKAGNVHAAGFRASFPIAFSFVYVYRLFRKSVNLIDGQSGLLEMQQRAISAGDALLIVSFAPYSREALQVARAARQAGCRVIAITDSETSPISLLADETLLFLTTSPSFFPSVAAGVAVSEALVELLASRAGKAVVQRINKAEKQLYESGAYLTPPQPLPEG